MSAGDLLAIINLKDPSKVKKILPFSGKFSMDNAKSEISDPMAQLHLILEGMSLHLISSFFSPLHEEFSDCNYWRFIVT